MSPTTVLLMVLLVVASALCAVAIWALMELVKTARSVRILSDDLDARVMPLLDKADVTVDAMNVELLRIDEIVTRVEEVTERVNSTSRTVQEVANAPVEIVNDIADKVRKAWKTRRHNPSGTGTGPVSAAQESAHHDVTAEQSDAAQASPEGWDATQP